ncbi:hypothetical protein Q7P37_009282 [Cladosporium fusiforme]
MSIEISRPNITNDTLVGFVQQPDGRGTLSILFSCILTLCLCVWSATHLDLPKHDERQFQYGCRYVKWGLLGLFGPEIVMWAAWRQHISAAILTKSMQETYKTEVATTAHPPWTMVHSFYGGMGGFAFDLSASGTTAASPSIPGLRRLHVTPRGLLLLAKCGLLPRVTKDDILDKSKTDGVGKLICCVQVGWMVVQAVTRLAVGLPISPLEINTIAHVVCALMNYALWWSKPKWVNEPTVLRGDWTQAMCAFMYMSSQISADQKAERDLLRNFGVQPEIATLLYVPKASRTTKDHQQATVDDPPQTLIAPDDCGCPGTQHMFIRRKSKDIDEETWPSHHSDGQSKPVASEEMVQTRWRLACEAIEKYPALQKRLAPKDINAAESRYRVALNLYPDMPEKVKTRFKQQIREEAPDSNRAAEGMVFAPEELVVDHARNWPGDDLLRQIQGSTMGMVMWGASTVYGAIHMAGWNDSFPTSVEMWFWRASAAYLVFSGLLWAFINLLDFLSGSVWLYWYEILAGDRPRRSHSLIFGLCILGGSLYVVARVYLVVEAFISLRALPAATYASPAWILTVPHL